MKRTIALITALTAAATVTAVATGIAPASAAAKDGPRPLVNAVEPVKAGVPTWVRAYWVTRRDVCDVRVTVSGRDVAVRYPGNTDPYTSFYRGDTLADGATDYTAFRVTVTSKRTRVVKLRVTIGYTRLPRGTFRPGVDPERVECAGPDFARTTWIKLPVLAKRKR